MLINLCLFKVHYLPAFLLSREGMFLSVSNYNHINDDDDDGDVDDDDTILRHT